MAAVSLFLLAAFFCVGAVYGMVRYRSPVNPLTFSAVVGGGITLLSGAIVYTQLGTASYTPDDVARTAMVSGVAFAGAFTPYLFRGSFPARVFRQVLRWLGLDSPHIATRFRLTKFLLLIAGALLSFIALAVFGGGGLRWLTDTRSAYIENRAGAGLFFALLEWLLVLALIYYLWSRRPTRVVPALAVVMLFAAAASYTGSKGNVLIMFVVFAVYYEYRVAPIPSWMYVLMLPLTLAVFGWLLLRQGFGQNNLLMTLVYFKDYFNTSAQFLSRFDEFGYRYGAAALSELWFYVPRALYPDKPYEYGATLIHEVLFPGAAERGHTPGLLPWTVAYLDWGIAGVFCAGVWGSFWQRGAYEHFIRNRTSFFAFLYMMQVALWAPLPFATPGITVLLTVMLAIYFRVTTLPVRQGKKALLSPVGDAPQAAGSP
ncbi:MAG: hypothetical protein WD802_08880 [Gemmatimonadaceae bacterium]